MRNMLSLLLALPLPLPLPVMAQSSVSISGMLDLGVYRGFDGVAQVGTIQRSNVALTGVEALGGGLKAVFRLSARTEMDTGASEGAGYKPMFHDESTVGLQGAWGTLRAGRAMTAMWANDWKFDPWANFNRIASPAWQQWHYLTPSDPFSNNGTAEYGRLSNGIFYDSPAIGGFTVRFSGAPGRNADPRATVRPVSTVLEYGRGAIAAMAAYERNSIGDKDVFVGAKYTVRGWVLMAARDDSRELATGGRSQSTTVGASYRLNRTITLKTGYGRQRLNAAINHFASLGADYALSRRTTLYGSFGYKRDALVPARTSFGFGISHTF